MKLEELNEKFNSLTRKRMKAITDLEDMDKELMKLAEKIYEQTPDYVRVDCISCNATGTIRNEEGGLAKCQMCNMKGYIWCKLFKGETNGN